MSAEMAGNADDHQRLYEAFGEVKEMVIRMEGRLDTMAATRRGYAQRSQEQIEGLHADLTENDSKLTSLHQRLDERPDPDRVRTTVQRVEQLWAVGAAMTAFSSLGGGGIVYLLIRIMG